MDDVEPEKAAAMNLRFLGYGRNRPGEQYETHTMIGRGVEVAVYRPSGLAVTSDPEELADWLKEDHAGIYVEKDGEPVLAHA